MMEIRANSLQAKLPLIVHFWSDKNQKTPANVTASSKTSVFLKCPVCLCEETEIRADSLTRSKYKQFQCAGCKRKHLLAHSEGPCPCLNKFDGGVRPQFWICEHENLLKNYGDDILALWDKDNILPPDKIPITDTHVYMLKCENNHPTPVTALQLTTNKTKFKCEDCNYEANNLAICCPDVVKIWDVENRHPPKEYLKTSKEYVFLKCDVCDFKKESGYRVDVLCNPTYEYKCFNCNSAGFKFPHLLLDVPPGGPNLFEKTCGSNVQMNWICHKCNYGINGEWYTAINHRALDGTGCPNCSGNAKYSYLSFVDKAKIIYDNKYQYPETCDDFDYKVNLIKIICDNVEHEPFWQTAVNHMRCGGCPACAANRMDFDTYLIRVKLLHNEKYGYTATDNFLLQESTLTIICPTHGEFTQKAKNHIAGKGCKKCGNCEKVTYQDFVDRCLFMHDGIYEYPETFENFKLGKSYLKLKCPAGKGHPDFDQAARVHMLGSGCPKCGLIKSALTRMVDRTLQNLEIPYKPEKIFDDLRHKGHLRYDYFILLESKRQFILESDGSVHFSVVEKFDRGSNDKLESRLLRDRIKDQYAIDHGYNLVRIHYEHTNNVVELIKKYILDNLENSKHFIITYAHHAKHLVWDRTKTTVIEIPCPKIKWYE